MLWGKKNSSMNFEELEIKIYKHNFLFAYIFTGNEIFVPGERERNRMKVFPWHIDRPESTAVA